jgi:hypothetical protein
LKKEINSKKADGAYSSPKTISKEHVSAPVGHTASQMVHQWQSSVSIMITVFLTILIAPQAQTLIQSPQRLHLFWLIDGISTNYAPLHLVKI